MKVFFFSLCFQIYRHGDRTPVAEYPTSPYGNVTNWPFGWGELTNAGRQQQYALGIWLRARYEKTLVRGQYFKNDIYIQSSSEDRTLDSAYCNLAGLYPPKGDHIWNKNIRWQPIPVHSVPLNEDNLIGPDIKSFCQLYNTSYMNTLYSDGIQQIINNASDFIAELKKYSGYPSSNISDMNNYLFEILIVGDALSIENLYHKSQVLIIIIMLLYDKTF